MGNFKDCLTNITSRISSQSGLSDLSLLNYKVYKVKTKLPRLAFCGQRILSVLDLSRLLSIAKILSNKCIFV